MPVKSVFTAKATSWIPLSVVAVPICVLGFAGALFGSLVSGVLLILGSIGLVGYNATAQILIDEERLVFRRYFIDLWSVPIKGTIVSMGHAGDFGTLLGLELTTSEGRSRVFPASLFSDDQIQVIVCTFVSSGDV